MQKSLTQALTTLSWYGESPFDVMRGEKGFVAKHFSNVTIYVHGPQNLHLQDTCMIVVHLQVVLLGSSLQLLPPVLVTISLSFAMLLETSMGSPPGK